MWLAYYADDKPAPSLSTSLRPLPSSPSPALPHCQNAVPLSLKEKFQILKKQAGPLPPNLRFAHLLRCKPCVPPVPRPHGVQRTLRFARRQNFGSVRGGATVFLIIARFFLYIIIDFISFSLRLVYECKNPLLGAIENHAVHCVAS